MGAECCKPSNKENSKDLTPAETEISYKQYSSISDKTFKKIESTYNFLLDFPLADYLTLVKTFSPETATLAQTDLPIPETYSSDEPFYSQPIDNDNYQSLLENQIIKHSSIYSRAGKNTNEADVFKSSQLEMIRALKLKLDHHFGAKEENRIQKHHIVILGLLYCSSRRIEKVKVFFDLFAKEGKLTVSEKLDEFLLSMFILSSYSILSATHKVGKQYDIIGLLPDEEFTRCIDVAELKDSENLVSVFNKEFFKEKKELSYSEVKKQFEKDKCGWLLDPKGIRYMIELNNTSKDES